MTMKNTETADTSAWVAAGVRHAVLSRTMPALRHDLAGSVSVLRMGVAVIKRRLELSEGSAVERDGLMQRVDALDSGIGDLGAGLRRLRHWDKPTSEALNAHSLVAEIWELARPFLSLRGIETEPLPEDAPWPTLSLPPQPLTYLLLAGIYHLAEGAGSAAQRITVTPEENGIRVSGTPGRPGAGIPEAAGAKSQLGTPPIDRFRLQCLADQLQGRISFTGDHSLLLHWG